MASEQEKESATPTAGGEESVAQMDVDDEQKSQAGNKADEGNDSGDEGDREERHKGTERSAETNVEGMDKELGGSKKQKVDREKTCPFLIRTFVKVGGTIPKEDLTPAKLPTNETEIYAWKDTSFRELAALIGEHFPEARSRSARLIINLLSHDVLHNDYYTTREATTFVSNFRPQSRDDRTLDDTKFQVGDFLSVGIIPNAEHEHPDRNFGRDKEVRPYHPAFGGGPLPRDFHGPRGVPGGFMHPERAGGGPIRGGRAEGPWGAPPPPPGRGFPYPPDRRSSFHERDTWDRRASNGAGREWDRDREPREQRAYRDERRDRERRGFEPYGRHGR
ncbi:hypothetical protein HDV00_008222 [Rhizophlyctis rosea]|nr:hypothetical protein HDV00_008222 [Rhizophlyctis rosea]